MNTERPEAWVGCSYKRETKWIIRRSQQMKQKVGAEKLEKKENKKEDPDINQLGQVVNSLQAGSLMRSNGLQQPSLDLIGTRS